MTRSVRITTKDINNCLPQIHCTECGYPSCKDYAVAIHHTGAAINYCPPGGSPTIHQLAELLDRDTVSIDPSLAPRTSRSFALIVENECIGCTLCIDACPVDAIIGARKHMHTVLEDHCTGCNLCVPACPVSCIDMHASRNTAEHQTHSAWEEFTEEEIASSRERFSSRRNRLRSSEPNKKIMFDRRSMRNEIKASVARINRARSLQEGYK
ncbi:MAG: electron transporter RnfB [Acidiferrobacteraceae bacterium]|nr:electron transporter RnfB [Acidiferrobacteraceae bacterium]